MSKQQNNWRYRCPEGHSSWVARGDRYYCEQCNESFDDLLDMQREPLRY